MSVSSNSEHLSVMTNDREVDNRYHNNLSCMWTIMLYYYICHLVHLICYAKYSKMMLQDDMMPIIILKSLRSLLRLATVSYFMGIFLANCS